MPRKVDTLFWDIEARYGHLEAGLVQAQKKIQGLATFIAGTPTKALGALAASVALIGFQAAKMAEQFDAAMRRSVASVPDAARKLEQFKARVLDLTTRLPFTAEQLAAGMKKVAEVSAGELGGDVEAMSERLAIAGRVAYVTGQDIGSVVGTIDAALDAFSQTGNQAAETVVNIAYGASTGSISFTDMATAISKVGVFAANAGVPLQELAAYIVAVAERGVPARVAMTGLRKAFGDASLEIDEAGEEVLKASDRLGQLGLGIQVVDGHLQGAVTTTETYTTSLRNAANGAQRLADAQTFLAEGAGAQMQLYKNAVASALTQVGNLVVEGVGSWVMYWRASHGLDPQTGAPIGNVRRETAWVNAAYARRTVRTTGLTELNPFASAGITVTGRRWTDADEKAAEAAAKAGAALAQDRTSLLANLRDRVAQLMGDTYAITMRQLDAIEAQFREKFGHAIPDEVTRGLASLRQAAAGDVLVANLGRQMDALAEKTQAVTGNAHATTEEYQAQLAALATERDWLNEKLRDETLSAEQHERIRAMLGQIAQLENQVLEAKKGQASAGKVLIQQDGERLERLQAQARNIEAAARGALQLARAFGLVDERTAATLENVAQIAANLPAALAKGGAGSILAVVGGLAGLIQSFGGESPEEKARKEALLENTEAIRVLAQQIGDVGLDITGRQFAGVRSAAKSIVGSIGTTYSGATSRETWPEWVQMALGQAGLSMADLAHVAEQLGIHIAGTVPTIAELNAIIEATDWTELVEFAHNFTGQMERLRFEFELFDINDPIDQVQRFIQAMIRFSGIGAKAAGALGGFDLSTPEGRAAAEEWIRKTYEAMPGMTSEGMASLLGTMTPQEFYEFLSNFETWLDKFDSSGATAGGGQQQWGVNRTITEATASRQLSLMTTMAYWLETIAGDTGAMAGRLAPPPMEELDAFHSRRGGGSTVNISIGDIVVQMAPGVTPADGRAIGQATAAAVAEELNRQLYQAATRRSRALGQATL